MSAVGFQHKGVKSWEVPPWSICKLGQTDISFSFSSSFFFFIIREEEENIELEQTFWLVQRHQALALF